MTALLISKLVGTAGLALDLLGAFCLYKYVFELPPMKVEQASLPTKKEEYEENGRPTVRVSMGVAIDMRAMEINRFLMYKEKLYRLRIRFGFLTLVGGLLLQALGNFAGHYVGIFPSFVLTFAVVAAVFLSAAYCFIYLKDLRPLPDDAGRNIRPEIAGDQSFTIKSDDVFQRWSQTLEKRRTRAGFN